jgi:deoxyribodipyrimidine photo-lyase
MPPTTLFWFRQDLRLSDHPALTAAIATGQPVIPIYLWGPEEDGLWAAGGATRWWLHHSLAALDASLREKGSRLVLRQGAALPSLRQLIQETGATAVHWQRCYEPDRISRDTVVKEALKAEGIEVASHAGALLNEPMAIRNKSGNPFQVFTPFWKHCVALGDIPAPLPAPSTVPAPKTWPASATLAELNLLPSIPWDQGMSAFWKIGEIAAHARLDAFIQQAYSRYAEDRNRPDLPNTSRLSPHLHFGEITPRQIGHCLHELEITKWTGSTFWAEVGWREFAYHLLYNFPHTPTQPLRKEWDGFPADDVTQELPAIRLRAWQRGRTGYPIVDAGMRELWETGWMHNRVRMIVASFLIKDLFLPWQAGAEWFWDTLVDADLASNTMGWQWTAGCGADAAPYFRIFNPTTQGEKFDPDGHYIRRYVPELSKLPNKYLHRPSEAPEAILSHCGVALGKTYPRQIVDHDQARLRALDAYAKLRGK